MSEYKKRLTIITLVCVCETVRGLRYTAAIDSQIAR